MSFLNTLTPAANGGCAEAGSCATRRPRYEINETEASFDVTVNLPGVHRDSLEITDENGELLIKGKRTAVVPEGLSALYRETSDSPFELALHHGDTIDSQKIGAELKDGVLQVKLSKAESAKPRKIAVS
jgi:HSP20 family protein